VAKRPHLWGPSTLNHGTQQCRLCLCTWEEAQFALGQECPKAVAEALPDTPLASRGPISDRSRILLQTNLTNIMRHMAMKDQGVIR
jgi:hypothetical protein